MKRKISFIVFLSLIMVYGFLLAQEIDKGVRRKTQTISPDLNEQFALIIGINKYKNMRDLNNAFFDAEEVKRILIERYGYKSSNIIDLYDEKANKHNIDSKLRMFAENKIQPDSLLIYFSGHGHLDTSYTTGYWLPCDVGEDLGEAAKFMSEVDLINRSGYKIENGVIQGMMKNCKAKHIFIIADSCYSGKLIDQGRPRSTIENKKLPDYFKRKSRQVLASGRERVSDGKPGHHSPFAKNLLQYLKENTKNYIIGSDLIGDLLDIIPRNEPGEEPLGGHVKEVGDMNGQFFWFYQYASMVRNMRIAYVNLLKTHNKNQIERRTKIEFCEKFLHEYKNIPENDDIEKIRIKIEELIAATKKEIRTIKKIEADYGKLKVFLMNQGNIELKINKCKEFLNNLKDAPEDEKIKKIFAEINRNIGALTQEKKAHYQKKKELDLAKLKKQIDIQKYYKFIRENPGSNFRGELKKALIEKDKNLPPEKFWMSITKNQKCYYERTFANGHIMIFIPELNFWADKYEVCFAQLEKNKIFRKKRKKSKRKLIKKLSGNHPAVVTSKEASEYCRLNGMRLLTEDEWEFIAGKERGNIYSWGKEEVNANGEYRANYDDSMNYKDGFDTMAPVKSFKKYLSPYGFVNLSGNVWEWVKGRKCKGGGYLSEENDLKIISLSMAESQAGFRCVKEVQK